MRSNRCAVRQPQSIIQAVKNTQAVRYPLSPQPLHSSLGFVCWCGRGQSYGSERRPPSEALPQLIMLLNEEGTPASISADVLCSLTDVSIFVVLSFSRPF